MDESLPLFLSQKEYGRVKTWRRTSIHFYSFTFKIYVKRTISIYFKIYN